MIDATTTTALESRIAAFRVTCATGFAASTCAEYERYRIVIAAVGSTRLDAILERCARIRCERKDRLCREDVIDHLTRRSAASATIAVCPSIGRIGHVRREIDERWRQRLLEHAQHVRRRRIALRVENVAVKVVQVAEHDELEILVGLLRFLNDVLQHDRLRLSLRTAILLGRKCDHVRAEQQESRKVDDIELGKQMLANAAHAAISCTTLASSNRIRNLFFRSL